MFAMRSVGGIQRVRKKTKKPRTLAVGWIAKKSLRFFKKELPITPYRQILIYNTKNGLGKGIIKVRIVEDK